MDYGSSDYFPDQTSRTKTQSFGETFRILGTAGLWKNVDFKIPSQIYVV